ncbi:MAG: hypothetical protein ACLSAF_10650 [Intestinimonas sp.]
MRNDVALAESAVFGRGRSAVELGTSARPTTITPSENSLIPTARPMGINCRCAFPCASTGTASSARALEPKLRRKRAAAVTQRQEAQGQEDRKGQG